MPPSEPAPPASPPPLAESPAPPVGEPTPRPSPPAPSPASPPTEAAPTEGPETPPEEPPSAPDGAPDGPPEPDPIASPPPARTPPSSAPQGPSDAEPTKDAPKKDGDSKATKDKKDKKDKKAKKSKEDRDDDASDDEADDDDKKKKKKPYKHTGLILEGKIGTLGCMRTHCRAQYHHDSAPGLALGGFLGGNFLFGFLDLGVEASWGTLRPRAYSGRNVLDLYSVDPARLQQVIAEEMGVATVPVDFSTLTLGEVTSRAVHAGPTLRVHILPRGRISAYVGAGLHYQLWNNKYNTVGGRMQIGWHGLSVPFTAGVGGYVLRRVAVGAEFSYIHALFLAASLRHPDLNFVTPLALIETAAQQAGTNLRKDLPMFWTLVLSLRVRI